MVYIVTLSAAQLSSAKLVDDLRLKQKHTQAYERGTARSQENKLTLIVRHDGTTDNMSLAWMGVESNRGVTGGTQDNITASDIREILERVPLDGENGLLPNLSPPAAEDFLDACKPQSVGTIDDSTWDAFSAQLRARFPGLIPTLEWLLAKANPPILSNRDPADQSWQEQRDAVSTIGSLFNAPQSMFSAWRRPQSPREPYLAGLIPEPVENSLIEFDAHSFSDGIYRDWSSSPNFRCDIHVLTDSNGRSLEIANVNATKVESALGTDMIYYHEPTSSFVLVQYKRLDGQRALSVGPQLVDQLERLARVARMSRAPKQPEDWRLGTDSCFLKLARWSDSSGRRVDGMYLPLSYVNLLLNDDCTLSGRKHRDGTPGRVLSRENISRHLVDTQFVDLVQHGYVGTRGVSVEKLRALVDKQTRAGRTVVLGIERSEETAKKRQQRARERTTPHGVAHAFVKGGELTLFDIATTGPE
ncbi:hypothetical protein [Nocardia tengchongensis]|uniref:hypothetical protein n=1 Tax=Nocardia tengchongensis TaxID=2055889 RepID=UPI00367604F1